MTWIDIEGPTKRDIFFLKRRFNLHPIVLDELALPSHRPRIENYRRYLFIIFHIPYLNKEKREVRPREIDIIVTKRYVITLHYQSILPLRALFDRCNLYSEAKRSYMNESTGHLLYYIMNGVLEYIAPRLEFIENNIDSIEEEMFQNKERKVVNEISLLQRVIIDFRRVVEPQKTFFDSLAREGAQFFDSRLGHYFYDLTGSYSRILNLLLTHKETVEALETTNQSLLTTKTNEVIRVLTVFATVSLPLTLISGIFGMNTSLPFVGRAGVDFWVVLAIMVIISFVLLAYLKGKKWF